MPITTRNLLDQYTEILQKIYGKHLKKVILYGSYARGDYRDDSDIDIMILLDLSDMDIKQYRHELSGETFDFNMDHDLDIKPIAKSQHGSDTRESISLSEIISCTDSEVSAAIAGTAGVVHVIAAAIISIPAFFILMI